MKLSLRELQETRTLRNTISTLKTQIEYILWLLANTTSNTASTVVGSGFSVEVVETLPAIPTTGYQMVFWTSVGAGVGDDQTWEAYPGQSRWYPCQKPTTLSGAPGA